MKILTDSEFESYRTSMGGNPVMNFARMLEIGQHFLIPIEEWKQKQSPSVTLNGNFRDGRKFNVRKISDGSGWVATRIK